MANGQHEPTDPQARCNQANRPASGMTTISTVGLRSSW
jgi:hypothetical protein